MGQNRLTSAISAVIWEASPFFNFGVLHHHQNAETCRADGNCGSLRVDQFDDGWPLCCQMTASLAEGVEQLATAGASALG